MAFFTSQQTTKLYAYDATEVTPWSVLLFGEAPVFEETDSSKHIVVGGWARFKCADDSILTIASVLRKEFASILSRKMADLRWDHSKSRELMVIKRLLLDQGLAFEVRATAR